MYSFPDKLKALRLMRNYTQKQVAFLLNISVSCYAGYEQGHRKPDIDTLREICILFNCSADELLDLP